ncbi:hypothetical protein N657DRAFT_640215 [Parathielavia appendiculata]|uniref:Uncharacterized protein n=1 Tax=Parathielavia appendiculata TaxID=2587402 RepID=A0AAN6UBF2_9PEZI|nr:hypothetical protein N657DRAFT_640215 [Parathielavia appendiculata]
MLLPLIFVLAAVVHLTSALPAYDNHVAVKPILASQFCILPDEFVVKNFDIFFLAADNNRTAFINFEYSNENTWIKTKCQYNETSVNVDPKGHAQRYACENKPANFTWWRNGTLTIYERSCPLEDK